jgi:cell division protein FtsA
MQESGQYIVGIDVGTTAVRCVVGYIDAKTLQPTIVGIGSTPNNGMRKGTVVNIVNVAKSIDQALEAAERMSGQEINNATVNINGSHIMSMTSKGVVAIGAGGQEITEDDIARAEDAATIVQMPANREILQVTPRSYRLDGQDNIKDPLGMHGVRLEVDAHMITALAPQLRNLEKTLEAAQIHPNYIALSSLAAARAIVSEQQVENGVLVLDFGGTTINLAVFEEGDLQHVAVLPVGSVNVTNDLAIGLRTDLDVAEKVKLAYSLPSTREGKDSDNVISIEHDSIVYTFETSEVDNIVESRLDEIFEMIDAELKGMQRSGNLPGGVVLVGGGANLQGIASYAKDRLRMSARLADLSKFESLGEKSLQKPDFAVVLGLMLLDIDHTGTTAAKSGQKFSTAQTAKKAQATGKKAAGMLSNLLKKLKP